MRFGTGLGIAALILIVLGPFINKNFGVGDATGLLTFLVWEAAPAAVLISLAYLTLLVLCLLLSAALITMSLVIRHAAASEKATRATNESAPSRTD